VFDGHPRQCHDQQYQCQDLWCEPDARQLQPRRWIKRSGDPLPLHPRGPDNSRRSAPHEPALRHDTGLGRHGELRCFSTPKFKYIVHIVLRMIVVKDAMMVIHLLKTGLLEASCTLYRRVMLPAQVYEEVMRGGDRYPVEVSQFTTAVTKGLLVVKRIKNARFLHQAHQYNISGGEAEAVALYWEEHADLLATDDDNVRKKRVALGVRLIGTPALVVSLLRKRKIDKGRYVSAVKTLKQTGWFSSTVYDAMRREVQDG